MTDETEVAECDEGAPAWVMTFADLMSLLMCFFVLLLSFSEIDAAKYKKIAGSMRMAFGVQREIEVVEPPKGTSIVAQEFSPAVPEPTPINEVRQSTIEQWKENLDTPDAFKGNLDTPDAFQENLDTPEAFQEELEADATAIKEAMEKEIEEGLVSVEAEGQRIIIRIQEKGSFPSGSTELKPGFTDVLQRITGALKNIEGNIVVAGHTDNIPISTARFRSNWELSSARAVTVAHELLEANGIAEDRLLIEGHADTHPLVPNDDWDSRAKNRRVEIILIRDRALSEEDDAVLQMGNSPNEVLPGEPND